MNSNVGDLVSKYRDKGILIDTNLLLVWLVGNVNPRLIGKIARTDAYSRLDYERLRDLVSLFARVVFIPQVLTEAGNLLKRNCPSESILFDLSREFARLVHLKQSVEARKSSKRITAHPVFTRLGYADAAILTAASGKHLLVTKDGPLQGMAWETDVDVLPFEWLQAL